MLTMTNADYDKLSWLVQIGLYDKIGLYKSVGTIKLVARLKVL